MQGKDPLAYGIATYVWVMFLAFWGATVSFIQKVRAGHARIFNFMEFVGELTTAGFVAVLTFWGGEAAELSPLVTAILIGIASHMGTRGLFMAERVLERKLNALLGIEPDGADADRKGEHGG